MSLRFKKKKRSSKHNVEYAMLPPDGASRFNIHYGKRGLPLGLQLSATGVLSGGKRKMGFFEGGGKMDYQEGGEVEGPSHEEGGVNAVAPDGQPVAEVEGGERIFSVEDTGEIEQMAQQIIQLSQQDQVQADEAAKQLGYRVVEMVARQEQVNPSQEGMTPADIGTVTP